MKKAFFISAAILILLSYGFSTNDARLLRFPNINKDLVAFVYAGDIWTVPAAGGDARRLTSHEGLELFPRISPDGKWIAFSAEYSGTRQVYVMPAEGGTPRQLTYYNDISGLPPRGGYDYVILGWTPDSKQILVLSNRTPYDERIQKFYLVSLEGGLETPLQIPEGGFGSFSPDTKKLVYSPIAREFRTWKRYKGGRNQDIWIYDLVANTSQQITDFSGTDQHPFWYNDKIFFVSDRDLKLNFWSYDLKTKEYKQITFSKEFDCLWPSGNNGLIAYENGGYINILDLNTGISRKLTVNINFDNPNRLPYIANVSEYVTRFGASLSPDGKRVIFDARGDLFSVPVEKGITANLTRTQGIRERYPVYSPDGKWIAYMSDETGEFELYLIDPEKKKDSIQLTSDHTGWKFPVLWSPDSKKLLYREVNRKLQVLDIQSKKATTIDMGDKADITDYSWSPDSRWVTYSKPGDNTLSAIWIYSLETGKKQMVSSGRYSDGSPVFSTCGKYIFFISDRDFNQPQVTYSAIENDYIFTQISRIYAIALTKDAPYLFKEENDLEQPIKKEPPMAATPAVQKKKDDAKPSTPTAEAPKEGAKPVVIDFNGIQDRIFVFPLASANYFNLLDIGGKILYGKDGEVHLFDLKTKDDKVVIRGVFISGISNDYKKLLYQARGKWGVLDVRPDQKPGDGAINMSDVTMKIDPVKEWNQMYNEGWLIFKDWFYAQNMHNVDWKKMKEKYAPLIAHLGHRADLDYILGELISELNCGHTYVNWGDFKRPQRFDGGLLGAILTADKTADRYKLSKIYKGENWNEETRSPLTEPGINISEGEYIIRIDGYNVTTKDNPYLFLENTAEKKISITVNSKPTEEGARTYWIKPIRTEQKLRYLDWAESRRALVDKLSKGRIGYIHMPNTAIEGTREFYKGFTAFNDKDAFIIDDRYNGGGWIPTRVIMKMAQRPITYWVRRNQQVTPDPVINLDGPMAMLINGYSSSGGDDLPHMFRKKNLGPLFGTRTWGGLVGYSWSPDLVDGASFAVPMFAILDPKGEFVVEGTGVSPDYEVVDRPEEIVNGHDPCIEAAVKYLLEQLEKNPPKKPIKPSDPDRSGWHEKMKEDKSTGAE